MARWMTDKRVMLLAVVLAVLGASIAVVQVSAAAFTAQTQNASNNWATGSVALSDDDVGSAMFTGSTKLVPGAVETNCIEVTYTGDVAVAVELYGEAHDTTGDATVADDLILMIEMGTGGTFGDCTDFTLSETIYATNSLTAFATAHDLNGGTPLTLSWSPSATGSRTFRFTVELDGASTASASEATQTFTWRASPS